MLDDLPEIGDIFADKNNHDKTSNEKNININEEQNFTGSSIDCKLLNDPIYIYISKNDNKWMGATFIDLAPGEIGIHVLLPVTITFHAKEMDNVTVKFTTKTDRAVIVLKEAPALVRWQERDSLSGQMKIGLHFPGRVKLDPILIEILNKLKEKKDLV